MSKLVFMSDEFDSISATTILPEWSGFLSRRGPYGSEDRKAPSDGLVRMSFGEAAGQPSTDDLRCAAWFEDNHAEQAKTLLDALFAAYPKLKQDYRDAWQIDDIEDVMPPITKLEDFRSLIGLHDVHVHNLEASDLPVIGYEFGCVWEEEHGLGVLMHGNRVAEIGHADTSFVKWIAERALSTDR